MFCQIYFVRERNTEIIFYFKIMRQFIIKLHRGGYQRNLSHTKIIIKRTAVKCKIKPAWHGEKKLEILGKNWLFYIRKILNQYIIDDCKGILFIKELVLLPVIFINKSLLIYTNVFLNEMSSTCLSFIKQKENSEQKH